MDLLRWLSDPTFLAETSPDFECAVIAEVCIQEIERLKAWETEVFSLVWLMAMHELDETRPSFLDLPSQIEIVKQDRLYHPSCLQGRLFYRASQSHYDWERDEEFRTPVWFTRKNIHDFVVSVIQPPDPRLAVSVPLAVRVGVAVGWLSGMACAQKDDAQAGLVLLTALVVPLLVAPVVQRCGPSRSSLKSRRLNT